MVFSREAGPLKIATFNINNINKRLHNLTAWLGGAARHRVPPELKAEHRAFPASTFRDLGYGGHASRRDMRCGHRVRRRATRPEVPSVQLTGNRFRNPF